jgi:hydroxypyruvate reductase
MDARATLRAVFDLAVARMDPEARVRDALAVIDWRGRAVHAIAVGKAACAMARGASSVCTRGLVVAPSDAGAPWPVMIGAHPVPDARSEAAGRALVDFVRAVPASDVLLALVSGGASALAEVPRDGITLDELVTRVRAVVARGADIFEINRVRTSLSAIKGGRLAEMCAAPVVTLVASDVVGDDPAVVGSGPTVLPGGDVRVVAGIGDLARAAVAAASAHGIGGAIAIPHAVTGDVADVAARIAAHLGARMPPLLVLAGEPTVRLPDEPGVGGRAQQLALLVARALAGRDGWAFLAAGSDGLDGTGPAAGAIVDGATWASIADGDGALARCDAGAALARVGATIVTGPTGVNHADLMLLLRTPA